MIANAFDLLTDDQKRRVWEIWHDPTEPIQFLYAIENDQIIGRMDARKVKGHLQYDDPQLPAAPRRPRPDPKPTKRDPMHEMPAAMRPRKPAPRRRATRPFYTQADIARGLFVIALIAYALIAGQ